MRRLGIGYVARAHGLGGELRVHLFSAGSTVLYEVDRVWIGGDERAVTGARATSGAVLLSVAGVEDRDAAEALKGREVEVARDAVELDENEYLLSDLPGCVAVDAEGRELGRVVDVLAGPQPLLVIHGDGRERLLPAVPEFVLEVDAEGRRVTVAIPEDLPAEPIG